LNILGKVVSNGSEKYEIDRGDISGLSVPGERDKEDARGVGKLVLRGSKGLAADPPGHETSVDCGADRKKVNGSANNRFNRRLRSRVSFLPRL
jgi:hypothetical protein